MPVFLGASFVLVPAEHRDASAEDAAPVASTAAPGKNAPTGPAPNEFASFADKIWPSVVKIYGAGGFIGIPAYGTGVVVDASGVIATAWSISLKTEYLKVVTDGGQRFEAKLLRADTKRGLALLKIENLGDKKLPALELADSTALKAGDQVFGVGNAFDDATGDERCAVMGGVVMAVAPLELRVGIEDGPPIGTVILTDVANNPGTQGGPLLTREGKLVGLLGRVVESKSTNSLINFAIPTATLKPFLADALAGKEPAPDATETKKAIPCESGIRLLDAHLTRSPPAYVDRVIPGSPAEKASVKADDLIFRVDGKVARTCRMFEDMLHERAPGDKIKLVLKRGDSIVECELELAPRKDN
jgi:serine protease Do